MAGAESKAYVFDWHDAKRDSFLYWLIPTLLGPVTNGRLMEFSDLTEKFTKVELGITINGVAVEPKPLIESIERNYDYHVSQSAESLIKEIGMDDLVKFLNDAQGEVINLLKQKLVDRGIKISDEDDWR